MGWRAARSWSLAAHTAPLPTLEPSSPTCCACHVLQSAIEKPLPSRLSTLHAPHTPIVQSDVQRAWNHGKRA